MRITTIATAVALTAMPLVTTSMALAQEPAKDMKGSPNANGYGHEQGASTTDEQHDSNGKDLKGPPNANGYQKK